MYVLFYLQLKILDTLVGGILGQKPDHFVIYDLEWLIFTMNLSLNSNPVCDLVCDM